MKTKSRSHVSNHASSPQVRVKCFANPQVRVEPRPSQRHRYLPPQIYTGNIPHIRTYETRVRPGMGQPVVLTDAYPSLGPIFGDRIVVRGSPEYRY